MHARDYWDAAEPHFAFGPPISSREVSVCGRLTQNRYGGGRKNRNVDAPARFDEKHVAGPFIFLCANEAPFFFRLSASPSGRREERTNEKEQRSPQRYKATCRDPPGMESPRLEDEWEEL
mmetsp:Transcript_20388/g.50364  ORF Transcript_20388/g.50364 Transcript_20388/m.50364 type:complete len:120 (+) Transcript_20388:35-394(+)